MLRTRLSRALLAALAVAALGGALVTSDIASAAPKIDPGFGNGPVRIDAGFNRGPARVDPGFNRDIGPQYTVKKAGDFQLHSNCVWIDRQGHHGSGGPRPAHPGPNGKGKICF